MEDPEPRERERLISKIEPVVRQQKSTLLQSFAGAPDPSSNASEGASQAGRGAPAGRRRGLRQAVTWS